MSTMKKEILGKFCLAGILVFLCVFPVFAQLGDVREYVIGIGDQLNINVWGIPELSSQVSVRLDGKITIPRLGDIQAAGLKISSLKSYLAGEEEGKETIGKYVKNPNITISLSRSAENIRISFRGALSQTLNVPRQTQVGQILRQFIPQLPTQPPPKLEDITVVSAEGDEFPVNWSVLQSGGAPQMDVRLEWGDEIRIPVGSPPTPTPLPMSTPALPPKVSYSEEELRQLLQEYPEALESVMAAASEVDEGGYHFDLAEMSEEQQEALGEEIIALLFYGSVDALPEYFTEISLVGISVDLRLDDALKAYLAFPASSPESLPHIESFREGERIELGAGEEEDVYLEEIRDDEMMAIVRQGDKRQNLSLVPSLSQAALAGIFKFDSGTKAVFSNLPERQSRKTRKRMFLEGETIGEDVKVAKISDQWVMLQKGEEIQLLLLRDSFNRPLPSPTSVPIPVAPIVGEDGELQISPGEEEQLPQALPPEERQQLRQGPSLEETEQFMRNLPTDKREQLLQTLPQTVRDSFNELLSATPNSE